MDSTARRLGLALTAALALTLTACGADPALRTAGKAFAAESAGPSPSTADRSKAAAEASEETARVVAEAEAARIAAEEAEAAQAAAEPAAAPEVPRIEAERASHATKSAPAPGPAPVPAPAPAPAPVPVPVPAPAPAQVGENIDLVDRECFFDGASYLLKFTVIYSDGHRERVNNYTSTGPKIYNWFTSYGGRDLFVAQSGYNFYELGNCDY